MSDGIPTDFGGIANWLEEGVADDRRKVRDLAATYLNVATRSTLSVFEVGRPTASISITDDPWSGSTSDFRPCSFGRCRC